MKPNPRSGTKSWPSPNACMAWNTKISSTQTLRLRHQQCIRHRPPRTMDTNMSCLTRLNQRFVRRKRCRGQRWPTPPPQPSSTTSSTLRYLVVKVSLGGKRLIRRIWITRVLKIWKRTGDTPPYMQYLQPASATKNHGHQHVLSNPLEPTICPAETMLWSEMTKTSPTNLINNVPYFTLLGGDNESGG